MALNSQNTSAAQITTNPKEDYKDNSNTKKVAPSYNQKMQDQEESEQKLPYFSTQDKKCVYAK
jgi:hypothetical protein